jgi:predicted nucleic acid-binding protein
MSDTPRKLIDANWILRYLLRDNEALFKKSSALLERVKAGEEKVVVLESVLAECVYVLLKIYKVERAVVADKLHDLLHYRGIANPDKKDLLDPLLLFRQTNLSIVDCFLGAKARNRGMELCTFDKEMEKKAGTDG